MTTIIKCDVCERMSTWNNGKSYYCDYHSPIVAKNNKAITRQVPIDEDVQFLKHVADILSKTEITSSYASILRRIGRRIQKANDEKVILSKNLRKYSVAPAPGVSELADIEVLNEIRNAEYSRYNAVGRLNEIYQKMDMPPPEYSFKTDGPNNDAIHTCTVSISTPSGKTYFSAQGKKKMDAKQEASIRALESYLLRNTKIG